MIELLIGTARSTNSDRDVSEICYMIADHEERVPVRMFTGSVTDEGIVTEACRGVNVVIHLTAVIDYSMFPDVARTMDVNVKGSAP